MTVHWDSVFSGEDFDKADHIGEIRKRPTYAEVYRESSGILDTKLTPMNPRIKHHETCFWGYCPDSTRCNQFDGCVAAAQNRGYP